MQQLIADTLGVDAAQQQLLRQLLQRGGGITCANIGRHFTHQHRAAAEVLAIKAEAAQRIQMLQHGTVLICRQRHRQRCQQQLAHQGVRVRLQRIEAQALVGGVLIHQPQIFLLILADDIGTQHFAHHPPRRSLFLQGLLDRLGLYRDESGNFLHHRGSDGLFFHFGAQRATFCHRSCLFLHFVGNGSLFLHRLPRLHILHRAVKRFLLRHRDGGDGAGGIAIRAEGLFLLGFGRGSFLILLHRHGLVKTLLFRRRSGRLILRIQRVAHRIIERVKHRLIGYEFHHRFGRVDIHIHRVHRQCNMHYAAGEFALQKAVAVRFLQCRRQQLGLDKASVDKEYLTAAGTVTVQGLGDKAFHRNLTAHTADRQQTHSKIATHSGIDGREQLAVARGMEHLRTVTQQLEGDMGMAEGKVLHDAADSGTLGTVLLHKLHSGGGVVKEVAHTDGSSLGAAGLDDLFGYTALQMEGCAALRTLLAGEDVHAADSGNGRQCLTTETQRANGAQVLGAAQLTGGVAQKGSRQLVGSNAAAVIGDAQIGHTAALQLYHDGGRTGIDGVFQQLFHHAGRALHHLTGGDQIRHMAIQTLNMGHKRPPLLSVQLLFQFIQQVQRLDGAEAIHLRAAQRRHHLRLADSGEGDLLVLRSSDGGGTACLVLQLA